MPCVLIRKIIFVIKKQSRGLDGMQFTRPCTTKINSKRHALFPHRLVCSLFLSAEYKTALNYTSERSTRKVRYVFEWKIHTHFHTLQFICHSFRLQTCCSSLSFQSTQGEIRFLLRCALILYLTMRHNKTELYRV